MTDNFKNKRVGEKHTTNEGYEVEIIEYFDSRNCTIIFNDKKKSIRYGVRYTDIKLGKVKNFYHPSVCEIGYLGEGIFNTTNSENVFYRWASMLERCYKAGSYDKHPTYRDVTVCEDWKCFQNFAKWHKENYIEGFHHRPFVNWGKVENLLELQNILTKNK